MAGKVTQAEPKEAVWPPDAWYSLRSWLSFLSRIWRASPVPTSEEGLPIRAMVTGVNEWWQGVLCSCALQPPGGAGAAVSSAEVGGAVGEGSSRKDFGLGPCFWSLLGRGGGWGGAYNALRTALDLLEQRQHNHFRICREGP